MDSFERSWRSVLIHCPLAGAAKAQLWTQQAYNTLGDRKGWSWLRKEDQFLVSASKTLTVGVTRGSKTVTGNFAASDDDRQFRVGNGIPYSIESVTVGVSATLDRSYGKATNAAASATILDAYVTAPSDFLRFLAVYDPGQQRLIEFNITEDELNEADPEREATAASPLVLASLKYNTSGRIQYELYPYRTVEAHYPFLYQRRPEELADATAWPGPLKARGDIIVTGALALAAEWPGDENRRNPYFNLQLAQRKLLQFERELAQLEFRDEEIYPTWWLAVGGQPRGRVWADSTYMRSHE